MTTHEDLIATIADIERQTAADRPMFDALLSTLEDCDPRLRFAVDMNQMPEFPIRSARALTQRPVLAHFIRA